MKNLIFFLTLLISTPAFAQTAIKDSSVLDNQFIRQNLIGKWKDQNSTTRFRNNGTYNTIFDNGFEEQGKWSVERNTLSLRSEILDSFKVGFTTYKILFFSPQKMEFQLWESQQDSTIWIAYKVVKKRK